MNRRTVDSQLAPLVNAAAYDLRQVPEVSGGMVAMVANQRR